MNELTRAELIEMICPTDATYDCNQGNCSSSCDKCEDVLNYLIDRYDAKVRVDAIEEFVERMKKHEYASAEGREYAILIAEIVAEQMMEGKNEK